MSYHTWPSHFTFPFHYSKDKPRGNNSVNDRCLIYVQCLLWNSLAVDSDPPSAFSRQISFQLKKNKKKTTHSGSSVIDVHFTRQHSSPADLWSPPSSRLEGEARSTYHSYLQGFHYQTNKTILIMRQHCAPITMPGDCALLSMSIYL